MTADGSTTHGGAYVVFGKTGTSTIDLDLVARYRRLQILGEATNDWAGASVSSAGDVNGDGLSDLIISALYNDSDGSMTMARLMLCSASKVDVGPVFSIQTQPTNSCC